MSLKSLLAALLPAPAGPSVLDLFPKTDPSTDGPECLHDCESCAATYPRSFKIDEQDALYGNVKGWSTHLVVGTGRTDWVRDVKDERGSVMEAVGQAEGPSNGRMMLSASNMPGTYDEPTTALLLPAFVWIKNLTPAAVPTLIRDIVNDAPTTSSPLANWTPRLNREGGDQGPRLEVEKCPHSAVVLMCSQRTRDARCGQSAPVLRRELERWLRPLGLWRDVGDERPGGVGVYFVSHLGGHKYSANVLVYRRPGAFGEEVREGSKEENGGVKGESKEGSEEGSEDEGIQGEGDGTGEGAAQCIWLARVRPEDCENLVRYTVLRGKVVKPERQLRGGFDRSRGLLSW